MIWAMAIAVVVLVLVSISIVIDLGVVVIVMRLLTATPPIHLSATKARVPVAHVYPEWTGNVNVNYAL